MHLFIFHIYQLDMFQCESMNRGHNVDLESVYTFMVV